MSWVINSPAADEVALVRRLSLKQKIRLLTGADNWKLNGEPEIGLRPIMLSDGPAGVRGARFDPADPSSSLPCPVALGATWDVQLVEELAAALGREARSKGIDVILGPTVNLVRTPLGGRDFECFSEDPLLTSQVAIAYVRGVQSAGVGATPKHFVANDSETERRTYDVRITESVLREMYLAPFEACVAEAGAFLVMASYNSVNGQTMSANARLLRDVLKRDWGFSGVVVSDWSGATSTVSTALAGLDLVMPGPGGPWGERLLAAVRTGKVPETEIDDKVTRLLRLARRVGALAGTGGREQIARPAAPDPTLIDPTLIRKVAGRSFVLLKNADGLLPLPRGAVKRVALIGPNALDPQLQGGGSVRVLPVTRPGILESLRAAMGPDVTVHLGCVSSTAVPAPEEGTFHDPVSGRHGVRLEIRASDGSVLHDAPFPGCIVTWWDSVSDAVPRSNAEIVMRARYRAASDGMHVIGAAGVGRMRIVVDGSVVAEGQSLPPRDVVESLSRPPELRVALPIRAGREVELRVEYRPDGGFVAMRLGVGRRPDDDQLVAEAVAAASAADVAVVVVGSASETESEGYDRESMALPGRQDELIRRVATANRNTVVVVNSGMAVLMPWADDVMAIVQAWLPGQAFGEALADVLTGIAEPAGRLPVTVPYLETDAPVLDAQPNAGTLDYSEGLLIGYRGYDRHGCAPLFCFGHGLGYTDWSYESIELISDAVKTGEDVLVSVTVRNSGGRAGREVVQLYVEEPDAETDRPVRRLAAFRCVDAEPGDSARVQLQVPARIYARFDEASQEWLTRPGFYTFRAGRSSRDLRLSAGMRIG